MLLVGIGASAAAGTALVLPMLLYYHFVDPKKNNAAAAITFSCTLTFALLLALLVPIDIMQASTTASGAAKAVDGKAESRLPSVTEAAAAAHAANASSAFTPAGAAAAAAALAGWEALRSAALPLTPELLQKMYFFLGLGVFFCCFLLTPAAIFYAGEAAKIRGQDVDAYDSPPCEAFFSALKKTIYFTFGMGAVLLLLLALRPGMPSPAFLRPEEALEPPPLQQQQQQQQQIPAGANAAGLMAAAAAAASAAAATASAAAARAAAAARRVDSEAVQLYTAQLLGVHKTGVDSVLFLGACLLCAAQVVWIVFGAFGLISLPLAWLRRGRSMLQKQQEVQEEIAALRSKQRQIQSKYAGNLMTMTPNDWQTLEELKAKQRLYTQRNYKLQEAEQGPRSAYSVLCRLLLPFRKTVGLGLLLLLLLMLISLGSVLVQRLKHSSCGWSCGFTAPVSEDVPTPADAALLFLSSYPPMDLWLVCCWLLLLLLGGLCGLLELLPVCSAAHRASSELQQHMRSAVAGKSSPQVLLLISALLAHHILAAGLCIFTVAPQYASFGNQTFSPQNGSDRIVCSLHAAAAGTSCRLTIFAAALSRVAFATPTLSAFLYYSHWLFLAIAVSCLAYLAFFSRRSSFSSETWEAQQMRKPEEDLEDLAAMDESSRLLRI